MTTDKSPSGTLEQPKPTWFPLRVGVLVFQGSEDQSDWKPQDFVQRLCDLAADQANVDSIDYDADHKTFVVVRLVNGQTGAMPYHEDIARVRVSEASPNLVSEMLTSDEEANALAQVTVGKMFGQFERMLHIQLGRGRCRVFARIGSPLAEHFHELTPNVFAHFSVTDWGSGSAATPAGERIYSIHLAPPAEGDLAEPATHQQVGITDSSDDHGSAGTSEATLERPSRAPEKETGPAAQMQRERTREYQPRSTGRALMFRIYTATNAPLQWTLHPAGVRDATTRWVTLALWRACEVSKRSSLDGPTKAKNCRTPLADWRSLSWPKSLPLLTRSAILKRSASSYWASDLGRTGLWQRAGSI